MFQQLRFIGVLCGVLMLSACGGSGGNGEMARMPDPPVQQPEPAPEPEPEPMPEPPAPPPDVNTILEGLIEASTVAIKGDSLNGSLWDIAFLEPVSSLTLSDMRRTGGTLERFDERQGVNLARARQGQPGDSFHYFDYGGWLEYSYFLLSVWNPTTDDPFNPSESVFADVYSGGTAAGTNPLSGSATWHGVVFGVDGRKGDQRGNVVIGDATLTIDDFTRPALDVLFTNLTDTMTNTGRDDMQWSDVPLTGGSFSYKGEPDLRAPGLGVNSLTGRFYGPNHEEVGGVFLRDEITGAFGASR